VVSTDVGGLSEMVRDGVPGKLVPSDDVLALTDGKLEFLSNQADIEREIPLFSEKFKWSKYVDELLALLPDS